MPRGDHSQLTEKRDESLTLHKIKDNLQSELDQHERAIVQIKKELEAIAVIEISQYAKKIKDITQNDLFTKATVKDRMISAISNMDTKFTRRELLASINKDGRGPEIGRGTFSVIFSRLRSSGYIRIIEEGHGHTEGSYTKGFKIG